MVSPKTSSGTSTATCLKDRRSSSSTSCFSPPLPVPIHGKKEHCKKRFVFAIELSHKGVLIWCSVTVMGCFRTFLLSSILSLVSQGFCWELCCQMLYSLSSQPFQDALESRSIVVVSRLQSCTLMPFVLLQQYMLVIWSVGLWFGLSRFSSATFFPQELCC